MNKERQKLQKIHPTMIRNKSSLNTVTEYPIDPDSIISIRTHFWCNGIVIDNQLQDHRSKSETITLYHLRENTIRGQPRLMAIRWLALTSIMKSEWGRSFHKYGTTFRIYQSSMQYCTVRSSTTHVEMDLDKPRNNLPPFITEQGPHRYVDIWITLTIERVESEWVRPSLPRVKPKPRPERPQPYTRPTPARPGGTTDKLEVIKAYYARQALRKTWQQTGANNRDGIPLS